MTRTASIILGCSLLAAGAQADLDTRGADWDGLSRWVASLEAASIEVRTPDSIDLAALAPGSGLALIGAVPEGADAAGLRRFVQEGGRLLLAVEGDEAAGLLRAFEAGVDPAPVDLPLLGGHPALPVLSVAGGGVLQGVDHLVTNHPVALRATERLTAAVRYADGTPFAYHLRVGEGEAVLVGDASLFINLMLDAADNARLAANLGAWLGRDGKVAVYVAGAATPVRGRYGQPDDPAAGPGTVGALNRALANLSGDTPPDDLAIQLFIALLLAGTLMYAVAVFPGGEPAADPATPPFPAGAEVERAAGAPGGPADPDALRQEDR